MKGRFEDGVGTFYSDSTLDGKPIKVRFIWSGEATGKPHWEQAYSEDGGKTWAVNWIMDFEPAAGARPPDAPQGLRRIRSSDVARRTGELKTRICEQRARARPDECVRQTLTRLEIHRVALRDLRSSRRNDRSACCSSAVATPRSRQPGLMKKQGSDQTRSASSQTSVRARSSRGKSCRGP